MRICSSTRSSPSTSRTPSTPTRRRQRIPIIADLDQPRHGAYIVQPIQPIEEWVAGSPLMHVAFAHG
jgi:hypothetical protein